MGSFLKSPSGPVQDSYQYSVVLPLRRTNMENLSRFFSFFFPHTRPGDYRDKTYFAVENTNEDKLFNDGYYHTLGSGKRWWSTRVDAVPDLFISDQKSSACIRLTLTAATAEGQRSSLPGATKQCPYYDSTCAWAPSADHVPHFPKGKKTKTHIYSKIEAKGCSRDLWGIRRVSNLFAPVFYRTSSLRLKHLVKIFYLCTYVYKFVSKLFCVTFHECIAIPFCSSWAYVNAVEFVAIQTNMNNALAKKIYEIMRDGMTKEKNIMYKLQRNTNV